MNKKQLSKIIKESIDSVVNEKTYNVPIYKDDIWELVNLYRMSIASHKKDIEMSKKYGRDSKMWEEYLENAEYKYNYYNKLYQQLSNTNK